MTLALMLAAHGPLDTWSPTLMVALALFMPALAALIILTFTIDSRRGSALMAILGSLAMLGFAALATAIEVVHPGHLESALTFLQFFTGLPGGASEFSLQWGVLADPLSAVVLLALALVSLLVTLASLESVRRDEGFIRLLIVMLGTTFAMAGVVLATNYFELFVFWVLTSLGGYLLIGHRWRVPGAVRAARHAFLYLGTGDALLLIAIVYIFFRFQDLSFSRLSLAYTGGKVSANGLLIMALLVFGAAMTRAAQLPLHGWMTGAAEAPAPAAALVLSATVAVSGVYLVARTYDLFHASPRALVVVTVVGGVSAIAAAVFALAQDQLKHLLTYVTMSNLGVMMLALGAGAYSAAVLHMVGSTFAVAVLFLGAGAVTAAMRTESLREMGGLLPRMPVVGWTVGLALAGISGIPPLSGFWSRGAINSWLLSPRQTGAAIAALAAGLLVAAAAGRGFATVFLGSTARRRRFEPGRIQDAPPLTRTALWLLTVLSLVTGWWALPIAGHGFLSLVRAVGLKPASPSVGALGLTAIVAVAGFALGWALRGTRLVPRPVGRAVESGLYVSHAVALAVRHTVWAGAVALGFVDHHVLDRGVLGVEDAGTLVSRTVRRLRLGRVQQTTLGLLVGVLLILAAALIVTSAGFKVSG